MIEEELFLARMADLANLTCRSLITAEEFDRLIALASIGAAVKPRLIAEAPKDGTWLMLFVPGHGYARAYWRRDAWISHAEGRKITRATHFFPYANLPQP